MRRIIVLIILAHLTLSGISQTASDSVTCLPNAKLRKVIRQIEDCKIIKEELAATQSSVSILEERLELKDLIIRSYDIKDSLCEKKCSNYEGIILAKDQQIFNHKTIEAIQDVKIRASRINRWIYSGVGIIIGVLVSLIK
jgi:hypothetical protein